MRKSSIVALFLMLIVALFVFENIHSLMKQIEIKLLAESERQAEMQADLGIMGYAKARDFITRMPYFDSVDPVSQHMTGKEISEQDGVKILIIKKPVPGLGTSLVFTKTMDTPLLLTVVQLRKILFWLSVILALLVLIIGFYFVYRLKREKSEETPDKMPPLQNYLLELQDAQKSMQQLISEQKQRSRQSEELNKNIISQLHLAVILINHSGQIEIFNPAAEIVFSRSYSLAKNRRPEEILHDYPELLELALHTDGKRSLEVESGQKTFFVDLIPLQDLGRLVLLRDITEEKKRERIQRINASLVTLGEMTASLAHEVKNSLGIIYGYAKMLDGNTDQAARIIEEIQFLTQMMENFLNFAKPMEELKWQSCDLKEMLRPLGEANGIEMRLPEGEMAMTSDPMLLNRIFSNLLLNSRQASARTVKIDFRRQETVDIVISDDGSGIGEKNLEKIWLPFFTTKEKGTGMGLALVKKMVNALNGDIQLLSSGRSGTSFLLSFYPR